MSHLHLMRFLLPVLIASPFMVLAPAVEKDVEYSEVAASQFMDIVVPRATSSNEHPLLPAQTPLHALSLRNAQRNCAPDAPRPEFIPVAIMRIWLNSAFPLERGFGVIPD
jgi:hypothetical protein